MCVCVCVCVSETNNSDTCSKVINISLYLRSWSSAFVSSTKLNSMQLISLPINLLYLRFYFLPVIRVLTYSHSFAATVRGS